MRDYGSCLTADGAHKRAYRTKGEAKRARASLMAHGAPKMEIYTGKCGNYHLGTPNDHVTLNFDCDRQVVQWLQIDANAEGVGMAEILRRIIYSHYGVTT